MNVKDGLIYKPDWEEVKKRYLAWWEGEVLDRCCIAVVAPKEGFNEGVPRSPKDIIKRWTDLEYITKVNEYWHRHIFYGGEAFPIWEGGYAGHTSISTFLGCPIHLDHQTGWHEPILNEDNWNVHRLKIDKRNRWWKFTLKLLHTAVEKSKGKSIPSIGAFGGCGDTLAALRGNKKLLLDLYDCPERVRDAELYLMDMWIEVYNYFYNIIRESAEGATCWFGRWSPGHFYAVENDFSYMISPKMFQKLFLPAIERQLKFLDHAVYHSDGVEAFRHIPALCELPKLQAIQVLPGGGEPSPLHYMAILKYIQAKGKNLHISVKPDEVETTLMSLSARGLFITTSCETEEEARRLLEKTKDWSCEGKTK